MTQEEKELLLKDLCARLPYRTKILITVDTVEGRMEIDADLTTSTIDYFMSWAVQPYLRPMYSMSEEEKKEFQACHCVYGWHPDFQPTMCNLANECNMFDWLITHHFDFRGLIEKGLALEAPEGMY